jgi:hypothetical protein
MTALVRLFLDNHWNPNTSSFQTPAIAHVSLHNLSDPNPRSFKAPVILRSWLTFPTQTGFQAPFAAGVTLDSFTLDSATDTWAPSPIADVYGDTDIRKLAKLDRLAVYWNSDNRLYGEKATPDILKQLVCFVVP